MHSIETELGRITHQYFWQDGVYMRRRLGGIHVERWNGRQWIRSNTQPEVLIPLHRAA